MPVFRRHSSTHTFQSLESKKLTSRHIQGPDISSPQNCKFSGLSAFFITVMNIVSILFQIIIALGIFNVWLLRSSRATPYRGKDAPSLKSEFAAYGLSESVYYTVGILKLSAAVALLLGIFIPVLVIPGAIVMTILMLGAIAMHIKVNDPINKSLPASIMLLMSLFLIV